MNARTLICILLTAVAALTFCPSASGQSPTAQPAAASPAEDLWTYTLPGAKVVAGVDWKRAKTSDTGAMLMKKLMATPGAKSKMTQVGLDFVDGVDRLIVTSPGQGTRLTVTVPIHSQKPASLAERPTAQLAQVELTTLQTALETV